MKFLKFLFTNFFTLFFTLIFTPFAISIISKLRTGDWFKYFADYSVEIIVIGSLFFILWIVSLLYYIVLNKIKKRNESSYSPIQTPDYGWKYLKKEEYSGVLWTPRFPLFWEPESEFKLNKHTLDFLDIEIPPRCPKCKTELLEIKTIFGWYKLKCINCKFAARKIYNISYHANQVERYVRRKIEKKLKLHL